MLRQNDAFLAKDRSVLDGIFQLPHVSWPGVLQQAVQACSVEPKIGQSEPDGTLAHKMAGQGENVIFSLTLGRHMNLNDAQTVIQVFTETIGADGLLEVAIGGRNHSYIDLEGPRLAHAHDFSLLKDAQQS